MRMVTKAAMVKAALALGLLGAVGFSSAGPVSAQGFYFDAPGIHVGVGRPYYRHYDRSYGSGYYDYGGGGNCYAGGCCPSGMTIQGGACKPYRGPYVYGW